MEEPHPSQIVKNKNGSPEKMPRVGISMKKKARCSLSAQYKKEPEVTPEIFETIMTTTSQK